MLQNCLVVCDDPTTFPRRVLNAVEAWPVKYKKRIQELIATLVLRNRFVPVASLSVKDLDCKDADCGVLALSTALPNGVFRIASDSCIDCPRWALFSSFSVNMLDYSLSAFSRKVGRGLAIVLHDNEWNQNEFEDEVLRPVLTSAKHVQIFDRYIGRSIIRKVRNHMSVRFSDNYKKTILWMASVYAAGGSPTRGVFEVFCGINFTGLNNTLRASIRSEIAAFEVDAKA